jgi:pyruvate/2-oxoglutarate dehydrogenase complex dihydrolipoamide acyltransferase (E2) component
MKNLIIAALLLAALVGAAFAQSSAPAQSSPATESPASTAPAPAASPPPVAPAESAAPSPAAAPQASAPAAVPAAGGPPAPIAPARAPSFLEQELEAASSEVSSGQVGNLTIEDVEKIAAHLAVAMQKERYVQRVQQASFALPGVGQFMAGDTLGGWLFTAWDVTVLAGTVVSAYFVLPANVQFGSLDYLNSPLSTIRTAWASNSIVSYLPFLGVVAGGMILGTVLKYVSADNAGKTARKNIEEGKVTFQPTLEDGGLGFGMQMNF